MQGVGGSSPLIFTKSQIFMLRFSQYGPVVKRLRHRPFTAVTRVRFPSGSPKTAIMRMVAVFLFLSMPSFEDGNRSAAVVNDDLNGRQSRGETEPAGETVFPSGSPKDSNQRMLVPVKKTL